ncbi:hypothetical protein MDAP_001067 [Mitosporidium daphniae]
MFSAKLGIDLYENGITSIISNLDVYAADKLHNLIHSSTVLSSIAYKFEMVLIFLGALIIALLYSDYSETYKNNPPRLAVSSYRVSSTPALIGKFFEPLIALAFWQFLSHVFLQVVVSFHSMKNVDEYAENAVKLFNVIMPFGALIPYMCSQAYEALYNQYTSSNCIIRSFLLGGLYWITRRSIRNLSLKPDSPCFIGSFYSVFFYAAIYILSFILTTTHLNILPLAKVVRSSDIFFSILIVSLMLFGKNIFEGFVNIRLLFFQLKEYVRYDYFYTVSFILIMKSKHLFDIIANKFGLTGFSVAPLYALSESSFTYFVFFVSKMVAVS